MNNLIYKIKIVPTVKHFTHSELEYPFTYLKSDNNIIIGNIFDNPKLLNKITPN